MFAEKKILITGAVGTLGQALVARFAQEGGRVYAWDRPDAPHPQQTLDSIAPGVTFIGCDLNDLPATQAQSIALAEELGGFDVLVNNAAYVTNKPHEEFSIQQYEEDTRVNSSAAFVLARALSTHMKQVKRGNIVCLTSLTLTETGRDSFRILRQKAPCTVW